MSRAGVVACGYWRASTFYLRWLVTDIEHFLNSLPEGCVSKRPDSRPMAEYRGFDPDRNPFDISQDKGYEIDVDRWVRGYR